MILGQSLKHVPVYVLRDEATIKEALHYGNYHDMTTTVVAGEPKPLRTPKLHIVHSSKTGLWRRSPRARLPASAPSWRRL